MTCSFTSSWTLYLKKEVGKKKIKQQDSWEQQFSPSPIWCWETKKTEPNKFSFSWTPKFETMQLYSNIWFPPIPYTFLPTKHDPSLVTYWLLFMARYRTKGWIFSPLERWVNKAVYQETKKCMHSVSGLRRKKRKEKSRKNWRFFLLA